MRGDELSGSEGELERRIAHLLNSSGFRVEHDSLMDLMTRPEVAALLGVAEKTLANWKSRRFGPPCFRVGAGVRYRRSDVLQWIAEQEAADLQA